MKSTREALPARGETPSPDAGAARESSIGQWLAGFLIWTLIGLSFAAQFYLFSLKGGHPVPWSEAIESSLADWYVWAVLSLPVLWLARRFPLEQPEWRGHLALHFCGSAICALLYVFLRGWLGLAQSALAGTTAIFSDVFQRLVAKTFFFNVIVYWVIVCFSHAFDYYRQFRERAVEAAELEKNLTQARLTTLQMQLNPHFLFNTLHAISALMHIDVDAADRMIARLSELLRRTLESDNVHEVPLREEIDFLKRYMEIEQTRFGSRLKIELHTQPDTLDAMVPNLLLQPLVENAIQHGIEPFAKPGTVTISSRLANGELTLEVSDNGADLAPDWKPGVGLSNTRARLQQLYRTKSRLDVTSRPGGGVTVIASFPFRTMEVRLDPLQWNAQDRSHR